MVFSSVSLFGASIRVEVEGIGCRSGDKSRETDNFISNSE